MAEEIIEGALKVIIQTVLRFLFHIIVEGLLFYTGEIVLFVISLGYKKPRWDYYATEKPTKFYILTDASVIVGFCFWLFIFFLINEKMLN